MSDEGKTVLRASKNANIIKALSEMHSIPVTEASDIYFQSETSELIENGVADLHCRSAKYLATVVWDEYMERYKR